MDIRKISVGPDYKSGAMHYLINQVVLGGNYTIHRITQDSNNNNFLIYIENEDEEVFLWKAFSNTVPVSIEYNINFI